MKAARNVVARTIIVQVTTDIGSASSSLHSRSNGLIVSKYSQNSLFCIFTQCFAILRDKAIYTFSQTDLFSDFFGLSLAVKVITNICGSFSPSPFICKHFKECHIQNIQKRRSLVNPGTSLQFLYDNLDVVYSSHLVCLWTSAAVEELDPFYLSAHLREKLEQLTVPVVIDSFVEIVCDLVERLSYFLLI